MLTFAAPIFLLGLILLPVVIVLHRIRVRRERREVAGSFLWRRAQDRGARRARMRPSVLLWLQLLAVAVASLAAARPQWDVAGPPLRILVVDVSISMGAVDGASTATAGELPSPPIGSSRLDVGRLRAETLADEGGEVAVVRLDGEPSLVLAPTSDSTAVRGALRSLDARAADADAERALLLARDVAASAGASGAEIHWLSDTPPPSTAGVVVHPLAGVGRNVGITGFERIAGQAWVRVTSTYPTPLEQPVELRRGDDVVASTRLFVPAGGSISATFPVVQGSVPLQAAIAAPDGDVLAVDDEAWAGAAGTVVALDRGFAALERALGAIDDVRVRVTSAAATLNADLRVLHGRFDVTDATTSATLLLPERDAPAVAATVERWDAADPLLRFVDLSALVVAHVDPPPFGEEDGWTTLAYGSRVTLPDEPAPDVTDGDAVAEGGPPDPAAAPSAAQDPGSATLYPLIQRRDGAGPPVVRFAFHPVRGDLTLRPAFPTWVVNLIDAVRGEDRVALGTALPEGSTRDGEPVAIVTRPGLYRVEGRTVHASVLDEDETSLPAPSAFVASEATTPDDPPEAEARVAPRDFAAWAIVLALLLLIAEWWGWSGGPIPGLRRRRELRPDRSGS